MTKATVAIVGAGPRGIALADRLSARVTGPMRILLIDPFGVGGRVWQAEQPLELLMNTLAGETSAFTDPSIADSSPHGPTLFEWAAGAPPLPPELAATAAMLRADDYAPRALFGHYLVAALEIVRLRASLGVEIEVIRDVVARIVDLPSGEQRLICESSAEIDANVVVLTLGHTAVTPDADARLLLEHAQRTGAVYAPPSHPLDAPVDRISAGQDVIVRGMALNFFDIMALLTSGRGGTFAEEPGGTGRLIYRPSGREPVIWAGSHRGIPPYARVDAPGLVSQQHFIDDAVISNLLDRSPDLDVRRDVWPLVVREATWAYLRAIEHLRAGTLRIPLSEVVTALGSVDPETPEWTALLEQIAPRHPLDIRSLAAPLAAHVFDSPEELAAWMGAHLDTDAAIARRPTQEPRAMVAVSLRGVRAPLRRLMGVEGISGASYRRDVLGWFGGLMRTIANGPPVLRIEQLSALTRARVVRFLGEETVVTPDEVGFVARSASLPGFEIQSSIVLDAFVQRQDISSTADPLLGSLSGEGEIRAQERDDGDGRSTRLPAVDVTWPGGSLRRADGSVHSRRFVIGVPIEGVRWNTALAGRSGVNSEFFRDIAIVADAVMQVVTADDRAEIGARA